MVGKGIVVLGLAAVAAMYGGSALAEGEACVGQQIEGLTAREARVISAAETRVRNSAKKKNKLSKVCSKVSNLSGLLVKITAGGHIGAGDSRYSGWSIICGSQCAPFPVTVYHCDGSVAWKMGYYGRWSGNGQARGYCSSGGTGACSVSSTRAVNKRKRCKGAVYLDKDGSRGKSCMRFNVNSSRNGGV